MSSRKSRRPRDGPSKNNENSPASGDVGQRQAKRIEIDTPGHVLSIAFSIHGKYILSGDDEGMVRRWRVEDGVEVGIPMDAGSGVSAVEVSRDEKWLVSGTRNGSVMVWDAKNHGKVTEFTGHKYAVYAVDVSPGGTRIATGSDDSTVCVWRLGTGERLLGPLTHDETVSSAKFSPDGRLLATGARWRRSVRIYDSQDAHLLFEFQVGSTLSFNRSLLWTSDCKQLFVLCSSGTVRHLDVFTRETRSEWGIHSNHNTKCIAMDRSGTFIAASAHSSVSFWDATTHLQVEPIIQHSDCVNSMAMSSKYDLAMGGGRSITVFSLCDILPSPYSNDIYTELARQLVEVEEGDFEETFECPQTGGKSSDGHSIVHPEEIVQQPRNRLADSQRTATLQKIDLKRDNTRLEDSVQRLRTQLSNSQHQTDCLNKTIEPLRANEASLRRKNARLEETVQHLRNQLSESRHRASSLHGTIESLRAHEVNLNSKITHLEESVQQFHTQHAPSQRRAERLVQIIRAYEQKDECETLYAEGRIIDAALSVLEITNTVSEGVRTHRLIVGWLSRFKDRCLSTLETIGDEASSDKKRDEAVSAYATALLLNPSTPNTLLSKWAGMVLIHSSANEALGAATKFNLPTLVICRTLCDILEQDGRVSEAIEHSRRIRSKVGEDTIDRDELARWEVGFRRRCTEKLVRLGDAAMDCRNYDEAIEHFSAILSLNQPDDMEIFIKRSKARALTNSWEEALSDADQVIKLDPSSYLGYERRHAALHGAERYAEAVEAYHAMLLKLDESPDECIRELQCQYIDAIPTIRRFVQQTIRPMPRVLIDATTGRLHDKTQQAAAFEALPIYHELVSSMTTELDCGRIWRVVKGFYRYVMLSHRWEHGEPLLQKVENISIYELEASLANVKLQKFCSLVRGLGFRWAWSDTCCVDKLNHVVLQESLVAMFTWFRGSSLTVVYLRGVSSASQLPGGLRQSMWNTRAWTYQEYVAAEIVQFYTEDWKPYLGLTLSNHKESPVIISEMQQVTGVSAQEMAVLRPGLNRVREKLYLASARQTTLVEDVAYSLLGIFNAAIPVIYGEGDRAVGRLLEHILTGSGDVTILAWTGRAGTYNSCLPIDLTVYSQVTPSHVPQPIENDEMDGMVTDLRSSSLDLSLAVTLHTHLDGLRSPSLAASRLQLPCIIFRLDDLDHISGPDPVTSIHVYHTNTSAFGGVEVKTTDNLAGMKDLCLVHPWIRSLLDQEFSDGAAALDRTTRALRFIARLRQPFGALLLEPLSRVEYRRVATDSLIMVQIREGVSLGDLIDNIRTIEVQ